MTSFLAASLGDTVNLMDAQSARLQNSKVCLQNEILLLLLSLEFVESSIYAIQAKQVTLNRLVWFDITLNTLFWVDIW